MRSRRRKWFLGITLVVGAAGVTLFIAALVLARRFEPYIREQAILYLQQRFDSEVELTALHVSVPKFAAMQLLMNHGHGTVARVDGEGVALRHKGRRDVPPMFVMKSFSFEVDLGRLFDTPKLVPRVDIDGMEINIPPKGQRPAVNLRGKDDGDSTYGRTGHPGVIIEQVHIANSSLTILPKDTTKDPLHFDLHNIELASAGVRVAMTYDAALTNAKPPGEILSKGTFGPWVADEPGDTPLGGDYEFDNANLGVFRAIAGTLHSTGRFDGTLAAIHARGEASVPDFHLTMAGNAVPLLTRFEVLVDGTNGNTILRPVTGTLGTTSFITSGGIIKHESDLAHAIDLDVTVRNGNLRDLLRVAMKGAPFMEGHIFLKTKIGIPPLIKTVRQKLQLDGQFEIIDGKFLRSKIQENIDTLSRRGQGQPKNDEIDQVVSAMAGTFNLQNEVITFQSLSFAVPGAGVDLAGNYDLDRDVLDFHGSLKLQAKVSQTMSGWKRFVLKPVDPFFAKNGAGTFLKIQVAGSSKEPKFGRDRGN